MQPTHPSRITNLDASIERTLAEIEGPNTLQVVSESADFDAFIAQHETLNVRMGALKTAVDNQTIFTEHMSDCCAIVLCTDYDENTRTFRKRSLMHATGSCLNYHQDVVDQSLELVRMASESVGTPRCLVALGTHSTLDQYGTISAQEVKTKDGLVLQPLRELQRLCEFTVRSRVASIAINPDYTGLVLSFHHHG